MTFDDPSEMDAKLLTNGTVTRDNVPDAVDEVDCVSDVFCMVDCSQTIPKLECECAIAPRELQVMETVRGPGSTPPPGPFGVTPAEPMATSNPGQFEAAGTVAITLAVWRSVATMKSESGMIQQPFKNVPSGWLMLTFNTVPVTAMNPGGSTNPCLRAKWCRPRSTLTKAKVVFVESERPANALVSVKWYVPGGRNPPPPPPPAAALPARGQPKRAHDCRYW